MPQSARPLPGGAIAALSAGNKIEAIKIVRQEWGVDLKSAKDAVDAYIATQPGLAATMQEASSNRQHGCFLWVLVLAAIAVAVYYFMRAR